MPGSAFSYLSLICAFGALAFAASAGAQPVSPPDFSGGEGGWVHNLNATFLPVEGSPSPVVQDPGHPFKGAAWRIGDLSNPNLKPWVKEVMKKDNDEIDHGKIAFQARSSCVPSGIPNMFLPGNPLLVIQGPKEVMMIKQGGQEVRHIYLNVPHSANVRPSWYGESVGHYEGDWLVVDTIAQDTRTFIDNFRTPHSDKLHVVERYHLINGGNMLEAEVTIEDPAAFKTPERLQMRARKAQAPNGIIESRCADGESFNPFGQKEEPIPIAAKPDF